MLETTSLSAQDVPPYGRFVAQLFFRSDPVLDNPYRVRHRVDDTTHELGRPWFSAFKHANLLGCQSGAGVPTPVDDVDYLPFPETLIFICFGLDSSRLAICRVKTPLRYSARMFSELTVFGKVKLRVNEP